MNVFESYLKDRFGTVFKRDAQAVGGVTRTIDNGDHKMVMTTKEMYVYFPVRFVHANLAFIEDRYRVCGYLSLVTGDKYAVLSIPNLVTMNPTSVSTVKIDEEDHYELYFDSGVPLFDTTRLSKDSTLVYPIYNELVSKPNMPIYFGYNDALLCLQKAGKYAGLTLEKTNVATEIIVATTTRNAEDPRIMFRHVIMQNKNANPAFFGLRNIQFGVSNLPTAIMGSYSDMGIDSILVHPPKKLEKYEKLLRM